MDVAKQFRLFCFDEMQVTEVGDAILMKRFFDTMWNLKVVLVVAEINHSRLLTGSQKTYIKEASRGITSCLSLI